MNIGLLVVPLISCVINNSYYSVKKYLFFLNFVTKQFTVLCSVMYLVVSALTANMKATRDMKGKRRLENNLSQ
jgi:hypothetical protein